jgi:aldehyde:ferredoxin oxidoreductase
MTTYASKLLRVNLTTGATAVEPIPEQVIKDFMGPRGIGLEYLYHELEPGIDPLGPENKLFIGAGALSGTAGQGFNRWLVTTKSPASGAWAKSSCGADFGARLRIAGFDAIIIEGKAEKPCYIYIEDGKAEILDAAELWGLDTEETQDRLRQTHGPKVITACIGPAGEKLVKYAAIVSHRRTAGRCGVGAVMGSKNLKAVTVNAPGTAVPHDLKAFNEVMRELIEIYIAHPRRKMLAEFGVASSLLKYSRDMQFSPVRNFTRGRLDDIEKIGAPEFNRFKIGNYGCYGCLTRCGQWRKVTEGPYAGFLTEGPEYETIFSFGTVLCNTDPASIVAADSLCDLYGLDTISTGVCIAFACELFERGIISTKDTDGLELTWGNHPAFVQLVQKIGKREGFGALLGEGVKRAAAQIGNGAENYAMQVKGLEIPGYEPRAVKGYALSYAVSSIGAQHNWGRPFDQLTRARDPLADEGHGEYIAEVARKQVMFDNVLECSFANSGLTAEARNQLLVAATGFEEFGDPAYLDRVAERVLCLDRAFIVREGFSRKDDTLPERFLTEPLEDAGLATGQIVRNLDGMIDEYYEVSGYTGNGIPTPQKLKELGLDKVIPDMERFMK